VETRETATRPKPTADSPIPSISGNSQYPSFAAKIIFGSGVFFLPDGI
jgi:hypothetical protein